MSDKMFIYNGRQISANHCNRSRSAKQRISKPVLLVHIYTRRHAQIKFNFTELGKIYFPKYKFVFPQKISQESERVNSYQINEISGFRKLDYRLRDALLFLAH